MHSRYSNFKCLLYGIRKAGGRDSEVAAFILSHSDRYSQGMNSIKQDLYSAGVLDKVRDDLARFEGMYQAALKDYYRLEREALAARLAQVID